MALPVNGSTYLVPALLLIYRPRNDERLSWPIWLTYSGRLTHIGGHPSAAGRAQDRESSPVRDRRFTTVPRHQLVEQKESMIFGTLSFPTPAYAAPLSLVRYTNRPFGGRRMCTKRLICLRAQGSVMSLSK